MSAKTMGLVWEKQISFNKAWVLMAMADHADHDGKNVFPRVSFIAWKTGYSIRQTKRILADLRDDGILLPDGHTRGGVVIYRIVLDHIQNKPEYVPEADKPGRPIGSYDRTPREPKTDVEKMGCQIVTPFSVTHNHHVPNKKSMSTQVPIVPEYLSTNPSENFKNSNSLFDEFDEAWSTPDGGNDENPRGEI